MTTFYATDSKIGIDLDTVGSACNYTPGTMVEGNNGSEWIYVLSGGAVTQGAMCGISGGMVATPITGALLTTASSTPSLKFAFAQTAFAASQWGFMATRGQGVLVRVLGGVGPSSVPLYTTDTAGALSTATATASQFLVYGVYMAGSVSAVAASAAAATANLAFPLLKFPRLGT